jgi:hypothetical protein
VIVARLARASRRERAGDEIGDVLPQVGRRSCAEARLRHGDERVHEARGGLPNRCVRDLRERLAAAELREEAVRREAEVRRRGLQAEPIAVAVPAARRAARP